MSKTLPIAFIAAATFFAAPSMAQTVYRCGDSYGQKPCVGGTALNVDDSRTASQRADTLEATKRDAKTANAMEKARLAEEAKPAQALLPPEKPPESVKQEAPTVLRAKALQPRKKKKKTKKAAA